MYKIAYLHFNDQDTFNCVGTATCGFELIGTLPRTPVGNPFTGVAAVVLPDCTIPEPD